jgi:hypothetical protein
VRGMIKILPCLAGEGDHAKHGGGADRGAGGKRALRFAPGPSTGFAGPPPLASEERS